MDDVGIEDQGGDGRVEGVRVIHIQARTNFHTVSAYEFDSMKEERR